MTDSLFDRAEKILDDGLVLPPDIDRAVDSYIERGGGSFNTLRLFGRYASASKNYYPFCIANYRAAKESGEALEMSAEESQVAGSIGLVVFGIMLGLLAADRIKTEAPN